MEHIGAHSGDLPKDRCPFCRRKTYMDQGTIQTCEHFRQAWLNGHIEVQFAVDKNAGKDKILDTETQSPLKFKCGDIRRSPCR